MAQDLCDINCWAARDDARTRRLVRSLGRATRLDDAKNKDLSPKKDGLSIEGLAARPDGALLIGLRNPVPRGRAVVIPLENPGELLSGAGLKARFGAPSFLRLRGLGVRSIGYLSGQREYVIVAGARGEPKKRDRFQLYLWSGNPDDKPKKIQELSEFDQFTPEAVVTYEDSNRIQILGDGGRLENADGECKKRPICKRFFTDRWRYIE